jgi:hypothetical protein
MIGNDHLEMFATNGYGLTRFTVISSANR